MDRFSGGILWRTESHAPQTAGYYADTRIGKLNLNDRLSAHRKLAMPRTCVDAGLYLGWFNTATHNSTATDHILARIISWAPAWNPQP